VSNVQTPGQAPTPVTAPAPAPAAVQPPAQPQIPARMPTVNSFGLLEDDLGFKELVKKAQLTSSVDNTLNMDLETYKCKADELPEEVMGTEKDVKKLYPDFLPGDTNKQFPMAPVFDYRGSDRPQFKKLGKFSLASRHTALIVFHDIERPNKAFGTAHVTKDTPKEEICLEAYLKPDTQMPSVMLAVKRSDGSTVRHNLYANSICRNDKHLGFDILWGQDARIKEDLPDDAHLRQLANQGQLLRIDIAKYAHGFKPLSGRNDPHVWSADNLDALELIRGLCARADIEANDQLGDAPLLDNQDSLLVCLHASVRMSIYMWLGSVEPTPEVLAPLHEFRTFMRSCMWAAAMYGNYWWYTLNTAIPLDADNYPFDDGTEFIAHPRWLTESCDVTFAGDKAISYKPLKWATFGELESGRYPDAQTPAFLARLSTVREIQQQDFELDRLTEQSATGVSCKLTKIEDDGYIVATLWFARLQDPGQLNAILPELRRRVIINMTYKGIKIVFEGEVCDDILEVKPHATVICETSKPNTLPTFDDPEEEHWVSVKFVRDFKSQNRHMNSISSLQKGHQRRDGVDLAAFSFGAPSPPDMKPSQPAYEFYANAEAQRIYGETIEPLNVDQRQAAEHVVTSNTGVTLILGPPGTGKTTAIGVIIQALCQLGDRILVTASSNSAVDATAESYRKQLSQQTTTALTDSFCRFAGAYFDSDWKAPSADSLLPPPADVSLPEDTEMSDDDQAGNDEDTMEIEAAPRETSAAKPAHVSWDDLDDEEREAQHKRHQAKLYETVMKQLAAKEALAGIGFASRKLQMIKNWYEMSPDGLSKADKAHYDAARKYGEAINTMRTVSANTRSKTKKTQLREAKKVFAEVDQYWTKVFLEKVHVVFCTNNSSCHDALMEYFKPTVIISDEAGQSTPPDSMTPWAANKESARRLVLGGDFKQLRPVVISRGRNEVIHVSSDSLFERIYKSKEKRAETVMFRQQYRMAPELSRFVSKYVYDGELLDAPNVLADNPIRRAFRAMFSRCDNRYNGSLRFAIDCNPAESTYFPGTTSYCNQQEAQFSVNMALHAVKSGIPAEEIALITPYNAQRRLMRKLLGSITGVADLDKIRCESTDGMQGHEAGLVIVTFVRNDPMDAMALGFVYQKWQLNVELSRAKHGIILVGNFGGWVTESATGDKSSFLNRSEVELFRNLVDDLFERQDIMHQSDVEEGFAGKLMSLKPFGHDIKARPHGSNRGRGRGGSTAGANRGAGVNRGGNANRGGSRGRGANRGGRGALDQAQGNLGSRNTRGGPAYAGPYYGHQDPEGTSLADLITPARGRGGGGRGGVRGRGERGGGRGGGRGG
jgi:hypothetical protein